MLNFLRKCQEKGKEWSSMDVSQQNAPILKTISLWSKASAANGRTEIAAIELLTMYLGCGRLLGHGWGC